MDISRREMWTSIASASVIAAVTETSCTIGADEDDKCRRETVLLAGPVLLGDLFQNMEEKQSVLDDISSGGGPEVEVMIKAFNSCRIYFVDKQLLTQAGSQMFVTGGDYPRLVAEGRFSFSFRMRDREQFAIHLSEMKLRGLQTLRGKSPTRTAQILVQLASSPYRVINKNAKTNEPRELAAGINFLSPSFKYGLDGKVSLMLSEKAPK